jgi:hypothetical protein
MKVQRTKDLQALAKTEIWSIALTPVLGCGSSVAQAKAGHRIPAALKYANP